MVHPAREPGWIEDHEPEVTHGRGTKAPARVRKLLPFGSCTTKKPLPWTARSVAEVVN